MIEKVEIEVKAQLCTSCRLCEITCSLFHENLINTSKALIRITDNFGQSLYEPHICQLCNNPPCVEACPSQALSQNEAGLIYVDEQLCSGCGSCVEACPYQAIWWQEELGRLLVCDRCGGSPTCIQFCTIGALHLAEAS